MQITAKARSCFSKAGQEHDEAALPTVRDEQEGITDVFC
jgi:hypothetical protein